MQVFMRVSDYIKKLSDAQLLNACVANVVLPAKIKDQRLIDAKAQYMIDALGCAHVYHEDSLNGKTDPRLRLELDSVKAPDYRLIVKPGLSQWLELTANDAIDRANQIWCSYYPDHHSPIKFQWTADQVAPVVKRYIHGLLAWQIAQIRNQYGPHKEAFRAAKQAAANELGIDPYQYYNSDSEDLQIFAMAPIDQAITDLNLKIASKKYLTKIRGIRPTK